MVDKLLGQLPEYERASLLINEIFSAVASELEKLNIQNDDNHEELFIDTAVKTLQIHAKDLGVDISSSLSLQQQRAIITAYYRAAFDQTTDDTIVSVASAFSVSDAKTRTTETPGIYEITFNNTIDFFENLEGFIKTINTVMPAHLGWQAGSEVSSNACTCTTTQCGLTMTVYPYKSNESMERDAPVTRAVVFSSGQEISVYPKGGQS